MDVRSIEGLHGLLGERRSLGGVVRALLTLVGVADAALALELWLLRHHASQSAAVTGLRLLAPERLPGVLAIALAALYLATRPKREVRHLLVLLTAAAGLLSLASGQPGLIAIAVADGLLALAAGSLWPERGDPACSRLGWSLLVVAGATIAALLLLRRPDHRLAGIFALLLVLAFAVGLSALALLDRNPPLPGDRDLASALALYASGALASVAPFALTRDKRYFWTPDRRAFLAIGCRVGVALALGPSIGHGEAGPLYERFRGQCRVRGWRPAFYQLDERAGAALPSSVRLVLGREAIVHLDRFDLGGPAMAKLRHDVARGRRGGVTVELQPDATVTPGDRAALRRLATEARARRRAGEMAFSVSRLDDVPPVQRSVGIARDRAGAPVAYVTWLWLPAAATFVLDEVRRGGGAPAGTMDLLIATSLLEFRRHARRASLGLAGGARMPLAERAIQHLFGLDAASPGLASFKSKFDPDWQPRYLVVDRPLDLPAVLLATFLLHYPELVRRLPSVGWASLDGAGSRLAGR